MEATLAALKHESDIAAATAETEMLEAAVESERGERNSDVTEVSELVRDYIQSQTHLKSTSHVKAEPYQPPIKPIIH